MIRPQSRRLSGGWGGVPVQPSGALWDNVRESRAVIRRLGTEVVSNLCPI